MAARSSGEGALAAGMAALLASCAIAPGDRAIAPPPPAERVFSAEVGEAVLAAQQKLSVPQEDLPGALADLDRALAMPAVTPYEAGVILYMRGGAKYQLEDVGGALADWERALEEGALAPAERLTLLYSLGQLHLSEGDYRGAVDRTEEWIRLGGSPSAQVHLNLVAAYVELGDLDAALVHGQRAFALATPPVKRHYDTLIHLYTELGMTEEREALVESMPDEVPMTSEDGIRFERALP
jgi:tetratricopeptide (TPR) repeat protein